MCLIAILVSLVFVRHGVQVTLRNTDLVDLVDWIFYFLVSTLIFLRLRDSTQIQPIVRFIVAFAVAIAAKVEYPWSPWWFLANLGLPDRSLLITAVIIGLLPSARKVMAQMPESAYGGNVQRNSDSQRRGVPLGRL
jgi:hypothetical protein